MAAYVDRPARRLHRTRVADLTRLSLRLSVIADMNSQRQIAENVLKAYLGPQTGPKVLAGQIRRGSGEAISAVLWSSDLRGFTELSDRLPGERVIALLNDLFDLQARGDRATMAARFSNSSATGCWRSFRSPTPRTPPRGRKCARGRARSARARARAARDRAGGRSAVARSSSRCTTAR